MSLSKMVYNPKLYKHCTTITRGKIKIHFNSEFSSNVYISIPKHENLIDYYSSLTGKYREIFYEAGIPWQHYHWILSWEPVVGLFGARMMEKTSQSKLLLCNIIPKQPPAEPLTTENLTRLDKYRKFIGDI